MIEPGRLAVEAGIADWALANRAGSRDETLLVGDLLFRTGVTHRIEARLGLTSYGFTRTRTAGGVHRDDSLGDLSLGFRWNLRHPDGEGISVAVQPSLSVPTGGSAIGSGALGISLEVPFSAPIGHGLTIGLTPAVSAAPDSDRRGQHLAYSGAFVLGVPVGKMVEASAEFYAAQDDNAAGHTTRASADFALAYRVMPELQLDASTYVGLTPDTPDVELIVGIAHRF